MRLRDWRLVVVICGLGLQGCASSGATVSAGLPAATSALAYYPLLPGWGWAYEVEREGGTVLALYSLSERGDGFAIIKHGDERIEYALLTDGIARREGGRPGDYILKSPMRTGDTWPVTDGTATVAETGKSVTLPSGSYRDCAVVEEVRRDPNRVSRTTYCRFVGPVVIDVLVFNPTTQKYEVAAHARIMSVSRPEDATPN